MTVSVFVTIFILGASASTLFTEAIKKAYNNAHKQYSANVIAIVNSIVVGGLGTAGYYILNKIEWNVDNVICLLAMVVCVWLASMIGYDKVVQMVKQIEEVSNDKE